MSQEFTRIKVSDLKKMVAYYQKTFQAEVIDYGEVSAGLVIGSDAFEFVETTNKEKGYVGIQFDDYDAFHQACARLSLDFSCYDGMHYQAGMEDLEGNTVQLHYYQVVLSEEMV